MNFVEKPCRPHFGRHQINMFAAVIEPKQQAHPACYRGRYAAPAVASASLFYWRHPMFITKIMVVFILEIAGRWKASFQLSLS